MEISRHSASEKRALPSGKTSARHPRICGRHKAKDLTLQLILRWSLMSLLLGSVGAVAWAENIDPGNIGSQYAYGENIGWVNLEPLGDGGSGVQVSDFELAGWMWGENIGWISLSCQNTGSCGTVDYGVTNNGEGVLAGYAWAENVGWISFSCENTASCATASYGVTIGAFTGAFGGKAWAENVGWISFVSTGANPFTIRTSWRCPDVDADLVCAATDCDDTRDNVYPGAPEVCDALDNDCDGFTDEDGDGDGVGVCSDCNDADASTYPNAPETNDGQDNQCPGDPGYGLVDEIAEASFYDPADNTEYSWGLQGGATLYGVARSTTPDFSAGCTSILSTTSVIQDPTLPLSGEVLYYAVRSYAPFIGSWGQNSDSVERLFSCENEGVCDNGLDDDGNGLTDCLDPDCDGLLSCEFGQELTCDDGLDNDGDGATDCSDTDCFGQSGCTAETGYCSDGLDNDGDGATDCSDIDCFGQSGCTAETGYCSDGLDNDDDGAADCLDADCDGVIVGCFDTNPPCDFPIHCELGNEVTCYDDFDNDADELVDCSDPNCQGEPATVPSPVMLFCPEIVCNDGLDNDGDGATDCSDIDCFGQSGCTAEAGYCSDGLDNDNDGPTDCQDTDCIGDPGCPEGDHCTDGLDNDDDGATDCADNDCFGPPDCTTETGHCSDVLDNDNDGLTDCRDPDCETFCGAVIFRFTDTAADDISDTELFDVFTARSTDASDFMLFEIQRPGVETRAWCSARADWYRNNYLARSTGGAVATNSPLASRWTRISPADWVDQGIASRVNWFDCGLGMDYGWCSEEYSSLRLAILPSHDACEAAFWLKSFFLPVTFPECSDGTWVLTIKVGETRQLACGF